MTDGQIITLIISIIVILLGVIYLYIYHKRVTLTETETKKIDVNGLVDALGGITNLNMVRLEDKRLKIGLINPKMVSQTLLKSQGIVGFLTGNELKLLIKENAIEIKNVLEKMISEVK
ncbi:Uncharacterised protein [Acholeplasma oculi]|uniref:Phosphotransferase system PTS, EIIB component, type 1 n=1 Tax=Acholeplasma oculi TaxID=35623 RepID=A0A061AJG5_9MOLU|nr:hypothetical protein [Acholeplasma oculi]CDR31137.1 Phosphotransferase system PTS, EIIB component, type 1 [Acholeplasma oculi]SUT90913.1 Uncharacterised protein [Acholeplasma oculi]